MIVSIIVISVLLFGIVSGLYLVRKNQDIRKEAQTGYVNVSGIYPHLAVFGDPSNYLSGCCNEAGIGAAVPWARKIWMMAYPPHSWNGSSGALLYSIDPGTLEVTTYPSPGGTHAGRMIHKDSSGRQRLLIGPHVVESDGSVRTIGTGVLKGRITAIAAHLINKDMAYYYTMEQGLYEVNVVTLAVSTLHEDANAYLDRNTNSIPNPMAPGAHGKGMYTGQGRLIIANNGYDPSRGDTGSLSSSTSIPAFSIIERRWFNDITGPDGLMSSPQNTSPIWSIGWDQRSSILMILENGVWKFLRFPKGSHVYDGAEGWYTEWPRIHSLWDGTSLSYVMNLYGLFYNFPGKTFSYNSANGVVPVSSHLSVVNEVFRLFSGKYVLAKNDHMVQGSDPTQSVTDKPSSNLQFVDNLNGFGKPMGDGGVWIRDTVGVNSTSYPFHLGGYENRVVFLTHSTGGVTARFTIETNSGGDLTTGWQEYAVVDLNANDNKYFIIPPTVSGQWVRFKVDKSVTATAYLRYEPNGVNGDYGIFQSLPNTSQYDNPITEGFIDPRNEVLRFLSTTTGQCINVEGSLQISYVASSDCSSAATVAPTNSWNHGDYRLDIIHDTAAEIVTETLGGTSQKYRLPRYSIDTDAYDNKIARWIKSVPADNRWLNLQGTFYELPKPWKNNDGVLISGLRKIRPIVTHGRLISDWALWRGMLVLAGNLTSVASDGHYFKTSDGKDGLWFGSLEDIWKMDSPRGEGYAFKSSIVTPGSVSDPFLFAGYEKKVVEIKNLGSGTAIVELQLDWGDGLSPIWRPYMVATVAPNQTYIHEFPKGFSAQWIRFFVKNVTSATSTKLDAKLMHSYYSDTPTPTPTPTWTPTPTPKPGDANGDGKVDGQDYIIWLNHYNQATSNGAKEGDFNEDGKVDGLDYIIWLNNYTV